MLECTLEQTSACVGTFRNPKTRNIANNDTQLFNYFKVAGGTINGKKLHQCCKTSYDIIFYTKLLIYADISEVLSVFGNKILTALNT